MPVDPIFYICQYFLVVKIVVKFVLATELLKTIDWVNAHAMELQVPLLILHGGADRVTLPESSRIFFERLTLADKERREYPDSYHELHNDLNYQEVLADMEDWINRH